MERIGIYGGSFDPIHLGHVLVAHAAFEELRLQRLFFVVAKRSPFKPESQPAPSRDRLRLLRLALAGQSQFEVDPQEVLREGISFSIDTVRNYCDAYPGVKLYYLIGADHIPQLHKWRNADELASLVEFVAIARPGERVQDCQLKVRCRTLQGHPIQISSSEVRQRIRSGRAFEHLLSRNVGADIRNNRLYFPIKT